MEWFEKLPDNCPPETAHPPNNEVYFRLSDSIPPNSNDFISVKSEQPTRKFGNTPECITRAVSLWDTCASCKGAKKMPTLKSKSIIKIILNENDGVVLKTRGPHHYSWWRSSVFNPELAYAESDCEPTEETNQES